MDDLVLGDNLFWQKGKHSLKFGIEGRRLNTSRNAAGSRRGYFDLTGEYTAQQPDVASSRATSGNGVADLILGWVSDVQYGNGRGENIISPYYGGYIQDSIKVSSRLTINAGLRWELFMVPYFPDPQTQSISRFLIPQLDGVSPSDEHFVFPKNGNDCGCKEDFRNFGPRLGIAYQITGNTVLRAGGGIYYAAPSALNEQYPRYFTGPPVYTQVSLVEPRETTALFMQTGLPPFTSGVIQPGVSIDTAPIFEKTLSSNQWYFDLQRNLPAGALVTVGYSGSKQSHLDVTRNINEPMTPSATIPWTSRKNFPQFTVFGIHDDALNANYEALTLKVEKRFSAGYTFLSSFTWSHNIDYFAERQSSTSAPATDWNLARERATSDLDRRLVYNLSALYELPLGKGKNLLQSGPLSWVLGNWELGGILSLISGTPVDSTFNVDNQNTGGRVRGNAIRDPNLPSSQRTIDHWFDTGFVVASAPGVIGNAGRNLILSPGRRNLDMILSKSFALPREGHRLQVRFEAFNSTNTPHFGVPNTAVGTAAAGQITAAEDPRLIQLGLKYVF